MFTPTIFIQGNELIMKIQDNRMCKMKLRDVPLGAVIDYRGDIYIKCWYPKGSGYSLFLLRDGYDLPSSNCVNDEEVIVLKAKLIIE